MDIIIQTFTRRRSFQIANNNDFLSSSLCLSAGVMVSLMNSIVKTKTNRDEEQFDSSLKNDIERY